MAMRTRHTQTPIHINQCMHHPPTQQKFQTDLEELVPEELVEEQERLLHQLGEGQALGLLHVRLKEGGR